MFSLVWIYNIQSWNFDHKHFYQISTTQIRLVQMENLDIISAAALLTRNYTNKNLQGLWNEILCIFVARVKQVRTGPSCRIFFWPSTLTARSSAVVWPTETHSTSLERSKPLLFTQYLSKSPFNVYFISIQSDLISIVFVK